VARRQVSPEAPSASPTGARSRRARRCRRARRARRPTSSCTSGSTFNGGLYAPRSIVRIISDSVFRGSIAANDVSLISNVTFRADPSLMRIAATFKSRYWTECTPQMTNPPDPESGC
jgi:hypothetical protein